MDSYRIIEILDKTIINAGLTKKKNNETIFLYRTDGCNYEHMSSMGIVLKKIDQKQANPYDKIQKDVISERDFEEAKKNISYIDIEKINDIFSEKQIEAFKDIKYLLKFFNEFQKIRRSFIYDALWGIAYSCAIYLGDDNPGLTKFREDLLKENSSYTPVEVEEDFIKIKNAWISFLKNGMHLDKEYFKGDYRDIAGNLVRSSDVNHIIKNICAGIQKMGNVTQHEFAVFPAVQGAMISMIEAVDIEEDQKNETLRILRNTRTGTVTREHTVIKPTQDGRLPTPDLRAGVIITHDQIRDLFAVSLQQGMNFKKGVILRTGRIFKDPPEINGILYHIGQNIANDSTGNYNQEREKQNKQFCDAVDCYKKLKKSPDYIRAFEKIKSGVWMFMGEYDLIDYEYKQTDNMRDENRNRMVFRFKLQRRK